MYKLSKLKNGANLISIPVPGTKAITVLALFPVGSRYETDKLAGASHFVEHMLFKGTSKRPSTQLISRDLDAAGAEYNAFTGKDYTGYYVKIESGQQELAFDLLSDMIFHSLFETEAIEKEKSVIVEEIRMYQDNPAMHIDSLFDQLVFAGNTLERDIAGSVQTVNAVSTADLRGYYEHAYCPSNMVLVVAGAVKEAQLKKDLKYFLAIDGVKKTFNHDEYGKFAWSKELLPAEKRVAVQERVVDQAQVIFGFPGLPHNHPDRFALSVLLNILGGTMSSRLFEEVRNKRGLAYVVRSVSGGFRDTGVVQIQAGLNPARLAEAVAVIKEELRKIALAPVTAKELADAKNNFAGRTVLSLEDSSAVADWFAKQFWFADKIETPDQSLAKIKKVTAADVLRLARKIFDWQQVRVAAIGPMKKGDVVKLL